MQGILKLTLYGNPPSSKNSRSIVLQYSESTTPIMRGNKKVYYAKCKPKLLPNKFYPPWKQKNALNVFGKIWTGEYPIAMIFKIIRKDQRRYDINNICQAIQDILVWGKVIPDDSFKYLYPIPAEVGFDKKNPRVEIVLMSMKSYNVKYGTIT